MRTCLKLAAISIMVSLPTLTLRASAPASDNASNSAYSGGWTNGSNGGSGWGGNWQLSTSGSGSGGFFVGDSNNNGGPGGPGINTTNSKAWGMYANGGKLAEAVRGFSNAMTVGQTLTNFMDNGYISSGGPSVGFGLRNASSSNLFEFFFAGGDSSYKVRDGDGTSKLTGLGWTDKGLRVEFTLLSTTNYALKVTRLSDSTAYIRTNSLMTQTDSGINKIRFWNSNAGSGSAYDAFFNSLSLVCNGNPTTTASNDAPKCVGDTLHLFATGDAGDAYSWTGPNGFSSTQQNPSIANLTTNAGGTYSVTRNTGGCVSAATTTGATINPNPAAPTASNNGPVCEGQALNLSASGATGSYTWVGPNGFTSSQQNPSVANATTGASGTYNVWVTVNGCSSPQGSTTASVTTVPTTSAGNNGPICPGATLQLTASGDAGDSYNWSGPNAFASTLQNPVISNATTTAAGVYSVTRVISNCGTSPAASTTVSFKTQPTATVSGSGSICPGNSATISAALTGTGSWILNWSDGLITTNSSSPVTRNVSPSSTTSYTVTGVSDANCSGSASGSVTVTVNQLASITTQPANQTVCAGQSVSFSVSATGTGPLSYQWRKSGGWGSAWQFSSSGSGAQFTGSSTDNNYGDASSNNGNDINTAGKAWALFNSGGVTEAVRPFNGGLGVGDTFSIDLDNGNIQNGGTIGVGLLNSNSSSRVDFFFTGGNNHYFINDGGNAARGGALITAIGFTRRGLHLDLTITGTNTYSLTVIRQIDGVTSTTNGTLNGTGPIDRVRLFNSSAGDCGFGCNDNTVYFNNIRFGQKKDDAGNYATWINGSDLGVAPISGAISNVYTVPSAVLSAWYDVIVSALCTPPTTSSVASLIVNVIPSADISAPTLVCPGFAGNIASVPDAGPGATYTWTVTNGVLQVGQGTRSIEWTAGSSNDTHLGVTVQSAAGCRATSYRDIPTRCPSGSLGLRADYYADESLSTLRFSRLDRSIDFDWGYGSPDSRIPNDHFAVRWKGRIRAKYSESYTFYTLTDDGVRLWVNGQLLINDWHGHAALENTASISLVAGQVYEIKMEYFDSTYTASARLSWSSSSQPKQVVVSNEPLPVDSDGDSIADEDEMNTFLTNPNASDTDQDGVNDYEEIALALSNPLSAEFNGSVTDLVVKNGSEFSGSLGQWQVDGTEVFAVDRRGYLEYSVTVSTPDVYRIEIEAREQNDYAFLPSLFDLKLYVDGEYVGRQTLQATDSEYGKLHTYTPYLPSGAHVIRIFWDNATSLTSLRVKSLRLQTLGGFDQNANTVKDWVESRLQQLCGTDWPQQTTSYVSPICLEGKGDLLSMLRISTSDDSANSTNLTASHGAGARWYCDIPLAATGLTHLTVSNQNGGLVETNSFTWVPKNILDGGSITIRQGDSLQLTASPAGATNGTIEISVGGVTNYSTAVNAPVRHLFAAPGDFVVNGTFSGNTQQSSNLLVKVKGHSFSSAPDCWVGRYRNWDNFSFLNEIFVQPDPRLVKFGQSTVLTNDGRRFSMLIDQNEPRYIVSRIGESGPIVSSARVNGFVLSGVYETYNNGVETFSDGTVLLETMLILSPKLNDLSVRVQIVVAGVTFDDGTIEKVLTAADFDELGQYRLRFVVPADVQTANCHAFSVYQGSTLVGEY